MVDLAGTWRISALSGADVSADPLQPPWLTFDGDGQVYGVAGVNRVRGTWELDGATLTFGPVVSTLMAGPDAAMACEREVLLLLQGAVTVEPAADELLLRGADDRTATLTRAEPGSVLV